MVNLCNYTDNIYEEHLIIKLFVWAEVFFQDIPICVLWFGIIYMTFVSLPWNYYIMYMSFVSLSWNKLLTLHATIIIKICKCHLKVTFTEDGVRALCVGALRTVYCVLMNLLIYFFKTSLKLFSWFIIIINKDN